MKKENSIQPEVVDDFLRELQEEHQEMLESMNPNLTQREWYERKMAQKQKRKKQYEEKGYASTMDHPFLKSLTDEKTDT